ncbi:NACHT and WD40 domain protein [Talaromyces proteolyticus]|uniref:NACHT and WD40 domain protein n=1 Tax=Talaromyces proteolyticus TaxID=1131652 RepID=A0AAD4KJJ6_9EURO|nr:NACHT and WD40 domain protein [Talaromyces proteolyticus]KAH8691808.1 NACHT and WD40 domain protein [Talaromyces proteolyticus]
MASSTSFYNPNYGMQIGSNSGKVEVTFNHADPLDKLPSADGAEFDSYVDQHEEFCLPGTRTELLSQIAKWAESSDGKYMFWLKGMAGTGKSTIARTVAASFKDKGQLGATFFFKRGEADRSNARYLISTITKQLVTKHPQLEPDVLKAIKNNPHISSKSLSEQFDKLLLQPLLGLKLDQPATVIVIIDALDECDRENDIQIILQLLFRLQEVKSVCLRIFLTSRPELPIRLGFRKSNGHQDLVLHGLPKPVIEHDIRLFLEHKLSEIRDEHLLPAEWPGNENMEKLVKMAVPLFIFAATICRLVGDRDWLPQERLTAVLQDEAATSISDIERTYLPVLNQLVVSRNQRDCERLMEEFQNIVGVIILLATPLSVIALARLTGISQDTISIRLNRFHSVLNIPEEIHQPVRILHLSFRDFLINTTSIFHVDEKVTHQKIVLHCLRTMNNGLKQNICDLSSYGTQRTNIDHQVINKYLSADLQYSCRYWVYHFENSHSHVTRPLAFGFVKEHFLHWLEALSLMGVISEAVAMMDILQSGAREDVDAEFSKFLRDAKRFILKNAYIASLAPLQLYCSGVVFLPLRSNIRKMFLESRPKQIHILPQVEDDWSPVLQTLEGHSGSVQSVAFSRDGQMVASGSNDNTVKLWDTKTGTELQTLKGHWESVQSVAFSPDGQMVASGSWDDTIKLWDTKTGTELQTLKGHSESVYSVAFSRDGQMVASGSWDDTIKLWDTKTGTELQTLKGHSESVHSVAFSRDSQMVASGSGDHTIKLWDMKTGTELQTLKGHSGLVYSVAFSRDGQMVASGSNDNTIKLWDTKTGTELQTLKGHWESVQSVAFSPDGQMVASGSGDHTIKLWDTKTGTELQTLKGHSESVHSVAFSPDSQMVASGSSDHTIKLWDTKTGTELQTLKGHSESVQSVAFSPDGQMVASGSGDHTIKLWDTKTGTELQTLKGHSGLVYSVAFSRDGQMVASGSWDDTIRLWDTKTGTELQTLKGHSESVQSVAFSRDSQMVTSGSGDHTIKHVEEHTATSATSIPQLNESCGPTSHNFNLQVSLSDNWVSLAGENILWLPQEHRQFTASAVKGSTLALGYSDGRVSIIGFYAL